MRPSAIVPLRTLLSMVRSSAVMLGGMMANNVPSRPKRYSRSPKKPKSALSSAIILERFNATGAIALRTRAPSRETGYQLLLEGGDIFREGSKW
jgi:hypothetical protein